MIEIKHVFEFDDSQTIEIYFREKLVFSEPFNFDFEAILDEINYCLSYYKIIDSDGNVISTVELIQQFRQMINFKLFKDLGIFLVLLSDYINYFVAINLINISLVIKDNEEFES